MRKRVVVVGMLNSIHTANWLRRFEDQPVDFLLYPSRQYRKLHPTIASLISGESNATFCLARKFPHPKYAQFWDFALNTKYFSWIAPGRMIRLLLRAIQRFKPDFVHALEIQSAGYLVTSALLRCAKNFSFIVTNWGSDIYYFRNYPEHLVKIIQTLNSADRYAAECRRDYILAQELGFSGKSLPLIPNAAFFSDEFLTQNRPHPANRHTIVAKAYGGTFGLGLITIRAVERALEYSTIVRCLLYSVTPDLKSVTTNLKKRFPGRVEVAFVDDPLPHDILMSHFANARVYVGCSRSDGVSTSFLEAIASGAYPIQTNTSCADEWIERGAIASVVSPDLEDVWMKLKLALLDDDLVTAASKANMKIARDWLAPNYLLQHSKCFYDL